MDGSITSLRPIDSLGRELGAMLAAGGHGLRLDLQPICAAHTLMPIGYEALLRWEHPQLGAIGAAEILAAAAATDQTIALDAWVLVAAFRLRASWPRGGPYLAVNLSPQTLGEGHAVPMIESAFAVTGADPTGLCLELPETAVIRHLGAASRLSTALRRLGVSLALDDFGHSFGPARALRDIPFTAVKIDPSMLTELDQEGPTALRAKAALAAMIDFAHAMGAIAIAEGVESASQMHILRKAGCDALQGWMLNPSHHL